MKVWTLTLTLTLTLALSLNVAGQQGIEGVWRGTTGDGYSCLLQVNAVSFLYLQKGPSANEGTFYFTGGMSQAGKYAIIVQFGNSVSGSYSAGDTIEILFDQNGDAMYMAESTGVFTLQLTRQSNNANALYEGGWTTLSDGNQGMLELKQGLFLHYSQDSGNPVAASLGWFDVSGDEISVTTVIDGSGSSGAVTVFTSAPSGNGFTMTSTTDPSHVIQMQNRPADIGVNGVWQATTSQGCAQLLELSSNAMFRSVTYNCPATTANFMDAGYYVPTGSSPSFQLELWYGFDTANPLSSSAQAATVVTNFGASPPTFNFTASGQASRTYTQIASVPDSVLVELVLDGDFAAFSSSKSAFLSALASLLGIDTSYVNIVSARAGSIVAKVALTTSPNQDASVSASQLLAASDVGGYTVVSSSDSTPQSPPSTSAALSSSSPSAVVVAVIAMLLSLIMMMW